MFLSEIRSIDGSVHTHTHTLTGSNFGKYVDAMALHFELHTKMQIKNKYSYFKKRVYPPLSFFSYIQQTMRIWYLQTMTQDNQLILTVLSLIEVASINITPRQNWTKYHLILIQKHIAVPVAQSVSARYLYSSTSEKFWGREFEPHLEHIFLKCFFQIYLGNLIVNRWRHYRGCHIS